MEILKIVKDPEKKDSICSTEVPGGEKEWSRKIFEEVMPEKFSKTVERYQAILLRSITPQTS